MTARRLSASQLYMLRFVAGCPGQDLAEVYRVCIDGMMNRSGKVLVYALAWRTADRTASSLIARGLLAVDGETALITDRGRAIIDGGR